jgi:hypothetical protein
MDPIVPHADCPAQPIPLAVLEERNTRTVIVDRHFALVIDRLLRSVRAVCWYPTLAEVHTFGPVNLLRLTPAALFRAWQREARRYHGIAERIDPYGEDSPLAALAASLGPKPPRSVWVDTRSAHAAVLAALELDPEAFALALRARPRPRPNVLTNDDYSRVWRHLHRYRECAAEAPQLLRPLHMGILAGAVDVRRPAAQSLREACRRAGLSNGAWRRLAHWPARFLDAALALGRGEPAWPVMLAYLRFLADAGIEAPPPGRLLRALARMVVNVEREPFRFDAHLPKYWSRQLLYLALARGSEARRAGALERYLTEEFLPVLQWARDSDAPLPSRKRSLWPSYVRRARAWARDEQARLASRGRDWAVGEHPAKVAGLIVVALRNPYDLLTEALAMRHCANHLAPACAQRGLRVFSLQDARGRRVATAALERIDTGYRLAQIKGFANTEVSPVTRLAGQLLAAGCKMPASEAGLHVVTKVALYGSEKTIPAGTVPSGERRFQCALMNMEVFPDGDSRRLRRYVTCAHPRGHALVEFRRLFDH